MFITGVCKHLELFTMYMDFPGGSYGKESPCNAGDLSSIPGLGRSPRGGHGSPFQYSYLENPHGQGSLTGNSSQGHKETQLKQLSKHAHMCVSKPLTVWITINCGKSWKRGEYQTTWSASWEMCMQVRKQQLELDMEQQTGSK